MHPEPQGVARGDSGDTLGGEEQLPQFLPAPAVGPPRVLGEAMQVDQSEAPAWLVGACHVEEKVAEIEILVEDPRAVERGGERGHLLEEPAFPRFKRRAA